MHNPLDSLKAAHDAGYLHGIIAGGLVFGIICTLLTGVALSWFMLRRDGTPDPDDDELIRSGGGWQRRGGLPPVDTRRRLTLEDRR